VPDNYDGDGYEFSIRLLNRRRLHVHVTRAALEILAGEEPADQLGTLAACMSLLRERALLVHVRIGRTRGARPVRPCDSAGWGQPPAAPSALIAPRGRPCLFLVRAGHQLARMLQMLLDHGQRTASLASA
jgi:hypothetical protein